jgi:predicted dehydrogenase
MTTNAELRWGFVGAGAMAQRMAADVGFSHGNRLVSVAARSPRRAALLASTFAARVEDSIEDLMSSVDVDIVYIATPGATHADLAVAALNHGKHVLVEKPFATTLADGQRIVDAAKKSGTFCMEAMWTRFIPAVDNAMSEIASGRLGELRQLTADFSYAVFVDPQHHSFLPAGGGALLDRGVYGLFLACAALGPVANVSSHAWIGSTGVDEDVTVSLAHSSGALSTVTASLRSRGTNEAILRGTDATLTLHEPFLAPSRYSIMPSSPMSLSPASILDSARPTSDKMLSTLINRVNKSSFGRQSVETAKGVAKASIRELKTVKMPFEGNGYSHQISAVRDAIWAGKLEEPRMTLNQSLTVMSVIDRARASWHTGNERALG